MFRTTATCGSSTLRCTRREGGEEGYGRGTRMGNGREGGGRPRAVTSAGAPRARGEARRRGCAARSAIRSEAGPLAAHLGALNLQDDNRTGVAGERLRDQPVVALLVLLRRPPLE